MTAGTRIIVLMSSVHETLKMEDALESRSIQFRSVVKPRSLGTDCGIALRIDAGDAGRVRDTAEESGCTIHGFYFEINKVWRIFEG